MHLIDDIDPVFPLRRRILNLLSDIADIFNAVVGSRINLHYVHGSARKNRTAGCALIAGTAVYGMLTVDCTGIDLCNTGLSRTSCSAEQIGMADPF